MSGQVNPTPLPLIDQLYAQLRAAAQQELNRERPNHTLTATALVHEAYLRLGDAGIDHPGAFYVAATTAMQRILMDYARARTTAKRGGTAKRLDLDDIADALQLAAEDRVEEILSLDAALSRLKEQDPQAAEIVRLRFFAGLDTKQTAEALGVSSATVKRDWKFARALLYRLLKEHGER